ncbi:MAG: hypothetical protein SVM79_07685 [Chloroflexota bacterium]|nr:hypothetical protein [Chloroflexota bacterium]
MGMLLSTVFLLSGCASTSNCKTVESKNATLSKQNIELQNELEALTNDCNTARSERDSLKADYAAALEAMGELEANYQSLTMSAGSSTLKNPTWAELRQFIKMDDTDTLEYIENEFDCSGFAITFRDRVWRAGFRSAYVSISFGKGAIGHALNAFQTDDEGLLFVDTTESDKIAYVTKGKVYGTIALDGVRQEYIDCRMQPDEFWKPLKYTHYPGNVFAYDYYPDYVSRNDFYNESAEVYNSDVATYNSAVDAYNRGDSSYSYERLNDWGDKLNDWAANLDVLSHDLGSTHTEPMKVISNIETYWN